MVDWATPGTALEARLSARSSFMIHIISTRRNMIAHSELCANRLFLMLIHGCFGDPELFYVFCLLAYVGALVDFNVRVMPMRFYFPLLFSIALDLGSWTYFQGFM